MKRRELLAGIALSTTALAGCLGGNGDGDGNPRESDDEDSDAETGDDGDIGDDGGDASDDVEYDRCENRIVRISNLPEPAETEALAAIENDVYETDDELLLAEVILVDDAYLRHDDRYYEVKIVADGDLTSTHD